MQGSANWWRFLSVMEISNTSICHSKEIISYDKWKETSFILVMHVVNPIKALPWHLGLWQGLLIKQDIVSDR